MKIILVDVSLAWVVNKADISISLFFYIEIYTEVSFKNYYSLFNNLV
jgi:hypothetical protein